MKRIIKLKGEIVLFSLLAMFLAIVIASLGFNIYRQYNNKSKYINVQKEAEDKLQDILDKSKEGALEDDKLKDFIENNEFKDYIFCLTDKDGRILAGQDYGIKSLDLSKFNRNFEKEILDVKVQVGDIAENPKKNKGYIKINDHRFIAYYYYGTLREGDSNGFCVLVIFILIFTFLMRGRVRYIVNMSKSLKVIAGGDLTERVEVKYKDELKELGQSINLMAQQLEREDLKKKEFITNISHDLRTPLTTIMGYLKIIDEGKYDGEEQLKAYLSIIDRKTKYLKTMIDEFFTYSKLSSRDMDIEMNIIYVQELLRQIVDEEERNFKERNLELRLTMDETPFYIEGNGELLERAISNLLSNALKYSKPYTKVSIVLNKQVINELSYGSIAVESTPREILSEDDMERLFERLYKKEASRTEEGSGLGLTITKEIMKVHKGFVKGEVKDERVIFKLGMILLGGN